MDKKDKSVQELNFEIDELQNRIKYLENFLTEYRAQMEDEFQRLQNELESNRNHLSLLLSDMSYDIRIPMNGIIGMIDILLQTNITNEQKEYIEVIANSSEGLLNTINDILDYSKIETGQITFKYQVLNMNGLVTQLTQQLAPIAQAKGLKLEFIVPDPLRETILCDEERLRHIINNLVKFSIKNTKQGSISVAIRTDVLSHQQLNLQVQITDTGQGISSDLQKVLFKNTVFNRIDEEVASPGLGPSIAYHLVKLLKGEIGFENHPNGNGTTYWFHIPVSQVITSDQEKPHVAQPAQSRPLDILLVEDNFLNQRVVLATLVKAGHQVDLAENGKIAFEKAQARQYDLILMDIQMPIMDGIEATQKIREMETNSGRSKIKIVAVTAFAMEKDREQCLRAGMDEFLAKPFKPNELITIINSLNI